MLRFREVGVSLFLRNLKGDDFKLAHWFARTHGEEVVKAVVEFIK